jgi:hypothetical protein
MIQALIRSLKRFASRVKLCPTKEQARVPLYGSGVTLRPKTKPQGSDHRECHIETTADRTQSTGKATAVDPGRTSVISFVGQVGDVLAASVTNCPAGHASALASLSERAPVSPRFPDRNAALPQGGWLLAADRLSWLFESSARIFESQTN